MKLPVTREKYQKRPDKFFYFIGLEVKAIEEKSRVFLNLSKDEGNRWFFNHVLKFKQFPLDKANRKEITGSTIRNY